MKKAFLVTWLSQTLVIFSAVLVVFTAGIVVYQETGSLLDFSVVVLCGYAPELLVIPFVGSIIDKLSRKSVLIICCTFQAIVFSTYFFILMHDASNLKITYIVISLSSAIAGIHRLTYNSSIALFTEDPLAYPRLNGLVQSGLASAHIMAPLTAGFLLEFTEVWSVASIAVIACLISALALLTVNFPELVVKTSTSSLNGLKLGINHIRRFKGLKFFLLIHAFANFARGASIVLFTPFVLSFSSEVILGSLRSTGGAGMAIGSLIMASWGPSRLLPNVIHSLLFCGAMILLVGITQNIAIIGGSIFLLFVATPILASLTHAIWQEHIPAEIQGRVFSVRDTVAGAALASGYVASPWIANYFFVPLTGSQGSGIGATYIAMGVVTILLALIARNSSHLKELT